MSTTGGFVPPHYPEQAPAPFTYSEWIKPDASSEGIKFDEGKLQWKLMPWEALEEVVKVLEFGAKKYAPDNWKKLDHLRDRAEQAAMRHLIAYMKKEDKDPETGLSHMAHLMCNALFLIWEELNGQANKETGKL